MNMLTTVYVIVILSAVHSQNTDIALQQVINFSDNDIMYLKQFKNVFHLRRKYSFEIGVILNQVLLKY